MKRFIKTPKNTKIQGCVIVVGVNDQSLPQALLAYANGLRLIVYHILHDNNENRIKFKQQSSLTTIAVNLTDSNAVKALFAQIEEAGHQPELVVFQSQIPEPIATIDTMPSDIETHWQLTGLRAFIVAQAAIHSMLKTQQGTLIFLGAYTNQPQSPWIADNAMQAGIRALSQSLSREFHPQGIHVSYIALNPYDMHDTVHFQAIAKSCWHIYQQPKSAWTQELCGL